MAYKSPSQCIDEAFLDKLRRRLIDLPYQAISDYVKNLQSYAAFAARTNGKVKLVLDECERLHGQPELFPSTQVRDQFFNDVVTLFERSNVALNIIERIAPLAQASRKIARRGYLAHVRQRRPTFVWGIKSWSQFLQPGAPGASFAFGLGRRSVRLGLQVLPYGGLCIWASWLADMQHELEIIELSAMGYTLDHDDLLPDENFITQGMDGLLRKFSRQLDRSESRMKHLGYDDDESECFGPKRSLEKINYLLSEADDEHHTEFETADGEQFDYYKILVFIPPHRHARMEGSKVFYPELFEVYRSKESHEQLWYSIKKPHQFATRRSSCREVLDSDSEEESGSNDSDTPWKIPLAATVRTVEASEIALKFYRKYHWTSTTEFEQGRSLPVERRLMINDCLKGRAVQLLNQLEVFDDVWSAILDYSDIQGGASRTCMGGKVESVRADVLAGLDLRGLEALL